MKLEEILPAYREGINIEYFHPYLKKWSLLQADCLLCIETFTTLDFRIKKEKVKKYQVLFYTLNETSTGLKRIYSTTSLLYESEEDFYKRFKAASERNYVFDKLIEDSKQEFDE